MSAHAQKIRENMLAFIRQHAREHGSLVVNTYYADGTWHLHVYQDGGLHLGGYAEELYPYGTTLEDLTFVDLGRLMDAALA